MADVRTFRAATMRDALDLVRDELGADAVILHTRQVARRRLLPWRKPLEEVEITASLTLEVGQRELRKPRKNEQTPARPNAAPAATRLKPSRADGARLATRPVVRTDRIAGRPADAIG